MNNLHFIYIFMIITGSKMLYFPNHYLTRVDLLMLFSKNTRLFLFLPRHSNPSLFT